MNCGHCTQTITKAIMAIDAKATVETDIPSKTVKVSTELDREKISAAVVDAGYDVLSIV